MKTMKRRISLIIVIALLISIIPISAFNVFAANEPGGSEDNPYVATKFAEFKEALETESIKFVKVGDIDGEVIKLPKEEQFIYAVTVKGEKTLILSGKAEFYAPADESHASIGSLIHLKKPADLTIKGKGSLIFKASMSNAFNAVVLIEGGKLTVDSEDAELVGDHNVAVYGRAVHYNYGWLTINAGKFIGKSIMDKAGVAEAVSISSPRTGQGEKVIINGGIFSTRVSGVMNGVALRISEDCEIGSVVISGGIFLEGRPEDYSIAMTVDGNISEGGNISNYLAPHYKLYDYPDGSIEVDSNRPAIDESVIVKDSSIINNVELQVVEPLAGEKPQKAITLTDKTSVSITEWKLGDDKLVEDDKFEEGQTYRCYILVYREEAFEFPDSVSATINGNDAVIYNKAKDFVAAYYDFVAGTEGNIKINEIEANVEEPIVGESPKEVVISTEGVKHGQTIWRDGEYELKDTDVFEAGKTYRLILSLGAEEGFEFRVSPPAIVRINGEEATVYPEIDKNNLGCYYDFVAGTEANKEINKVDANVEEPIVGASPKEAIISTEGIKFYQTVWRDGEYELKDTDVFEAGKTYRLALALQAEEGFEFRISPPPIAKINGQEATVFHEINEKYLGFYYDFTVDAEAPLAPIITTTNLADGKVDQVYSENLVATGDTPMTWSLEEGSLPEGLELDTSTGEISGGPAKAGESNFKIKATNDQGHDIKEFTITILEKEKLPQEPKIITVDLADGKVATSYSQTLLATGDTPMTWTLEEGNLPEGLELNTSTGQISGSPSKVGTSNFKIRATNAAGQDIKEFTITIATSSSGGSGGSGSGGSSGGSSAGSSSGGGGGSSSSSGSSSSQTTPKKEKEPEKTIEIELPEIPLGKADMNFIDVKESDWFYQSVKEMYEKDLMAGTSKDKFSPNENTSRAMIVTILYRLENSPKATKTIFKDVLGEMWYTDAISWAGENKVVKGYGNGLFKPDNDISREELAKVLYGYARYKVYDLSNTGNLENFTDHMEVSEWARDSMSWAVDLGIMKGKTESTLNPKDRATRAEIATILERFIKKLEK